MQTGRPTPRAAPRRKWRTADPEQIEPLAAAHLQVLEAATAALDSTAAIDWALAQLIETLNTVTDLTAPLQAKPRRHRPPGRSSWVVQLHKEVGRARRSLDEVPGSTVHYNQLQAKLEAFKRALRHQQCAEWRESLHSVSSSARL